MSTTTIRGLLVAGLAGLLLAGCTSNDTNENETAPASEMPTTTVAPEPEPTPEPIAQAVEPSVDRRTNKLIVPLDNMGDSTRELQGVFYFDFDQAIVKRAGHQELNAHASFLAERPNVRIRLEGHADERGTREYNLALGERRANAVRAYLLAQGAKSYQMEVVSYGEEKPVAMGSSESSWSRNRRVEIVYR